MRLVTLGNEIAFGPGGGINPNMKTEAQELVYAACSWLDIVCSLPNPDPAVKLEAQQVKIAAQSWLEIICSLIPPTP